MSISNIKDEDLSILSNSQRNDVAELLIYRGKKYSENKNKLKLEYQRKELEKWTFKPELISKKRPNSKNKNKANKNSSISEIKFKVNSDLENYIKPLVAQSDRSSPRLSNWSDAELQKSNFSVFTDDKNDNNSPKIQKEIKQEYYNEMNSIEKNENGNFKNTKIESRYFQIPGKDSKQTTHQIEAKQSKIDNKIWEGKINLL